MIAALGNRLGAVQWPRIVVETGGLFHLAAMVLVRAIRPPYSYGPEFVEQFRFAVKIAFFPLVITSFALSFGPAGIQAVNFLGLFGALDRLGGLYVIIVVRLFAPFVTAIVIAGVVGTAVCADLGARQVREETDALSVLGIDPIRSLIVPRVLAIILVTVLCDIIALLAGVVGAIMVVVQNGAPLGPFFSTFFGSATPLELGASFVKCALFGTMIAIVCCYKGMNAAGGSEGVGKAVNQSVVIAFLMIGATDYVFTQFLLATNPILSEVR
ncbi:MAG: ABC transporter permease [Solirubrobacteraceae bacterium]|nr:ABC transporter permease [Solirubrobacteraceae bacterium]